jgi:hypothetical protein
MNFTKNLITPQSLLIEKTALELAAVFYEAGRSSGLTSKHKDARAFAKANVEKFIPKAVELLMDILAKDSTPQDQRDLIYEAFLERTNDKELSNIGIPVFKNDIPYLPDNKPAIYDKRTIDDMTTATNLFEGRKPNS